MPPRYQPELDAWMAQGLFEATAVLLTIARIELRDVDALRRLQTGLAAERRSLEGFRPLLWRV